MAHCKPEESSYWFHRTLYLSSKTFSFSLTRLQNDRAPRSAVNACVGLRAIQHWIPDSTRYASSVDRIPCSFPRRNTGQFPHKTFNRNLRKHGDKALCQTTTNNKLDLFQKHNKVFSETGGLQWQHHGSHNKVTYSRYKAAERSRRTRAKGEGWVIVKQ